MSSDNAKVVFSQWHRDVLSKMNPLVRLTFGRGVFYLQNTLLSIILLDSLGLLYQTVIDSLNRYL